MGILENLLSNYGREKYKKQNRLMRMKLHPSTIGMCQRKIVFDMIMVPIEIPDAGLLRVFDNGHSLHDRYETLFEEMGVLVEKELSIEYGDISGHTDAWIRIYSLEEPNGTDYLVELKSAFSRSFEWMIKNNRPKKEHIDQLTFYLHLIRKIGAPIEKGIIFVENKDTQEVWEYVLPYDEVLGKKLEKKAQWCISLAKERKLPPIPPKHTPSYYKCSICSYSFYCHSDSFKRDGTQRYPIPFNFGSQAYREALDIINASKEDLTIPNFIQGDTNGELATEVEIKNYK